jgi:peptidoglycan/xylan/chitin deacetylase (PgdA/CDA1 family)
LKRFIRYVYFVIRSKGIAGVLLRVRMLLTRFDLSGKKMKTAVAGINALGAKYNFKPAMIVPAVILQRHARLLKSASHSNLEFGIHGYTHKDHRPWTLEKQKLEVEKAKTVFEAVGIPYNGFRAPYLSCNANTDMALETVGIKWNSDHGVMWNYPDEQSRDSYSTGEAIDILYRPAYAAKTLAIPRIYGNMTCIPLVLPDDEILVDRYGITDTKRITDIWSDILDQTYARGDLFVLQFHPERYTFCEKSMAALLQMIADSNKSIWVAGMNKIAEWWQERSRFEVNITEQPDGRFKVESACSDRGVLLARNMAGTTTPFSNGYQRVPETCLTLETNGRRPCIGINPECDPAVQAFIRELGFAHEVSAEGSNYSLYFDAHETCAPEEEVAVLTQIEESEQPLLRYWLWPDGYQSAFATSHDLDCVTLADFVYRALGR